MAFNNVYRGKNNQQMKMLPKQMKEQSNHLKKQQQQKIK